MSKIIRSLFVLPFILVLLMPKTGQSQLFNEDMYKFGKALHFISSYYIDSVNRSDLVEKAVKEMIADLDPHTTYLTKEEVQEMSEPLEGNFEGIGIQFNVLKDTIYVISTISGGPSEKVGLKAGDRIVRINGETVAGIDITTSGVRDRLLGEKGSKVNVSIKRPGVDGLLEFTIKRDKIPIHSRDAAYMADTDIGYIKLNRFAQTTNEEFSQAVGDLKGQGAESFILDLRDNGGGYLEQAIQLADEFLDDRKLIVYTEGLKVKREENFASEEGVFEKGNLIILIDEGSASASEIVAGAVQDWDRGMIIGRRSFGKGLVQRPVSLPDGSMIRLTVARYHTPTGRVIQKPYNNGRKEYRRDILRRFDRGEMTSADSIKSFPDSLKYSTKQEGRVVFGGGGIMPDVFIPLDTTSYSDYFNEIIRLGVLNSYILQYIDENRTQLTQTYPDFQDYKNRFEVDDQMLNGLISMAESEDIEPDEKGLENSKQELKLQIKALIARDLWDMSEYFHIVNQKDPGYQKAVEALNNWETYSKKYLEKK
ncbi:MAG: S41 family peptidase [Bacteroidales bacterium]|nr:S41 family peptidase [Bacteroidales bacterium]